MKKIIILLVFFFSFSMSFAHITQKVNKKVVYRYSIENKSVYPLCFNENLKQGGRWGVFFVNFAIGAIGAYSIYGIGAGIVSAGLTYFIFNGENKAFWMGVFGGLLGIAVGLGIRLATI